MGGVGGGGVTCEQVKSENLQVPLLSRCYIMEMSIPHCGIVSLLPARIVVDHAVTCRDHHKLVLQCTESSSLFGSLPDRFGRGVPQTAFRDSCLVNVPGNSKSQCTAVAQNLTVLMETAF